MKIAVCGCGIGGLAAAIFAHRAGFNVTVFDQFDAPRPVGSGLVVQPVGLRILEQLGASGTALAKGAKGYYMIGHEAKSGRIVLDVTYGPKNGSHFGLGIHRASLFLSLMEIAQSENITIAENHRAVSTHAATDGRYLQFENHEQLGPFDLVIDATGASSPLSPLKAKSLPYGAIWGTVDWPEDCSLQYDCLQQKYRRASKMIGILPIGTLPNEDRPKAALFWSLPINDIEAWHNSSLDQWRNEANRLWPELRPFTDQITSHSQMTPAIYSHGSLRRPFGDRIAYIGDAAHRASPQLGQGANMALLDAAALVKSLELFPLPKALSTYQKSRRIHLNVYQALSWIFTPMYQSDNLALPILRDYVLGPLSTVPPAPTILTSLVNGTLVNPIRGLT